MCALFVAVVVVRLHCCSSFFFTTSDEYSYSDFFLLVSFYFLVNVLSPLHHIVNSDLMLYCLVWWCFFFFFFPLVFRFFVLFALSYLSKNNNDVYHYWILPVAKVAPATPPSYSGICYSDTCFNINIQKVAKKCTNEGRKNVTSHTHTKKNNKTEQLETIYHWNANGNPKHLNRYDMVFDVDFLECLVSIPVIRVIDFIHCFVIVDILIFHFVSIWAPIYEPLAKNWLYSSIRSCCSVGVLFFCFFFSFFVLLE